MIGATIYRSFSSSLWRCLALSLVLLFMSGCVVHKPPEYEAAAVADVCSANSGDTLSVSYLGKTKLVTVDFVRSWDELDAVCGATGGACVHHSAPWDALYEYCLNGGGDCGELKAKAASQIYIIEGGNCLNLASHELGHVFGVPGLDTPRVASRR